jgi:pilus assembly protein CpaB
MRGPAMVMTGIAVLVGGVTVVGGRYYMDRASARPQPVIVQAAPAPVATAKVVVAAQPLRFGMELSSQQLREVSWPVEAVPPGSASSVEDFLKGPEKRVVIAAMEANEPVLATKVTGPGQRATLSAILAPGMAAITIQVGENQGVGGLVMPGDRVNVMFTRRGAEEQMFTDVLLQNIRVLAIDHTLDQRSEKPVALRHATLEVMPQDAKRVALASSIGNLALMLRKAGEEAAGAQGKIAIKDLLPESGDPDTTAAHGRRSTTVKVTRNGKVEEYTVLTDRNR